MLCARIGRSQHANPVQACFSEEMAPRCAKCMKPCVAGPDAKPEDKTIVANQVAYHARCFRCTNCGVQLGLTYYIGNFGPLCTRCKR